MKYLVFLLTLAGASFGMTSLMMNQVMTLVPKAAQKHQKSMDSPLAALAGLEGLAPGLSGAGDGSAADPRRAALNELAEGFSKRSASGGLFAGARGGQLLSGNTRVMSQAGKFFKKNRKAILPLIWWGVPLLLMVLTLLSIVVFCYAIARALCTVTFKFCTLTLTVMSLGVMVSAIAGKPELITAIPRDMWFAPILFILGSATVLKLIDMNSPVWNEALKAFGFPILSSAVVLAWTYFKA